MSKSENQAVWSETKNERLRGNNISSCILCRRRMQNCNRALTLSQLINCAPNDPCGSSSKDIVSSSGFSLDDGTKRGFFIVGFVNIWISPGFVRRRINEVSIQVVCCLVRNSKFLQDVLVIDLSEDVVDDEFIVGMSCSQTRKMICHSTRLGHFMPFLQ